MSLLFMDGFGHTDDTSAIAGKASLLKWDSENFGANIRPKQTEGRFSPGALNVKGSGGGGGITKVVPEGVEMVVGFSFKSTSGFETLVSLNHNQSFTPPRLSLQTNLTAVGNIVVFTPGGAACTILGILPRSDSNTWVFIEFRIKLGVTDGEIEVRVDGGVECLETAVDTVGTPTDRKLNGVQIAATSNSQNDWIDDLYLLDTLGSDNNTFLHDGVKTPRISFLKPKANGGINTFGVVNQAGDTAHWQAVDDPVANRALDHVASRVTGNSEDYVMETFVEAAVTPGTIHGIQVANAAILIGNSPVSFIPEMVIAGTRYTSGVVSLGTAYDHCSLLPRGTDPSDDTAWTAAKVEAVGSAFSIINPI